MLARQLQRQRPVCARRLRTPSPWRQGQGLRSVGTQDKLDADQLWLQQANMIRSGHKPGLLEMLESRGLVKDVAGGKKELDWLLTEKPVGAYVGVDPTAPSLHVGHLLPLMVLYWMYVYGYPVVTLLGTGTVQIGDPSGRTTARSKQSGDVQTMNKENMMLQLNNLWGNVKALSTKHRFFIDVPRDRKILHNNKWLREVSAIDLMKTLGSGMRLGSMLARDSVRTRLESGNGMSLSEFCYPLFQGYDWWHLYSERGVQVQIGGSDQYGNICAGMEAVDIMRRQKSDPESLDDARMAPYGLTTPLLTTASGEKFGKSAGNAVWLDQDMMSSFDLYQYFLSTSDADVERYLKLFTFLPLDSIRLVMAAQEQDASKRTAQHLLARELVELAHGAEAAVIAQSAHKNAFAHGSNTFYLGLIRSAIKEARTALEPETEQKPAEIKVNRAYKIREAQHGAEKAVEKLQAKLEFSKAVLEYKKSFAGSSTSTSTVTSTQAQAAPNVTPLPLSLVQSSNFAHLLYASGLCASKSEAHRLIKSKGAYVLVPNSGSKEQPKQLQWDTIAEAAKPQHYLVDFEALVLRSGKKSIRTCWVLQDEEFDKFGLSAPGWPIEEKVKENGEEKT